MTENRRQRDPVQARLADLLGDGRVDEALLWLHHTGGLQAFEKPEEARAALLEGWAEVAFDDPARALILAHDRADVLALDRDARDLVDQAGWLGPTRLVASGREWAAGDRLVCRRNDYRPEVNVRNGTRGTVETVYPQAGSLLLRTDDGRRVHLPGDYLEHVRHALAITGHAAQGATVDRTFVLASTERGSAEWAYVAASRHRVDLQLFVAGTNPDLVREALARVGSRTQRKGLAIDRLTADRGREHDRAAELRLGARRTQRDLGIDR